MFQPRINTPRASTTAHLGKAPDYPTSVAPAANARAMTVKVSAHDYDYDLVIIGAGVGGHGAALHATYAKVPSKSKPVDCLHWMMPGIPDVWTEKMLRLLENWNATAPKPSPAPRFWSE